MGWTLVRSAPSQGITAALKDFLEQVAQAAFFSRGQGRYPRRHHSGGGGVTSPPEDTPQLEAVLCLAPTAVLSHTCCPSWSWMGGRKGGATGRSLEEHSGGVEPQSQELRGLHGQRHCLQGCPSWMSLQTRNKHFQLRNKMRPPHDRVSLR